MFLSIDTEGDLWVASAVFCIPRGWDQNKSSKTQPVSFYFSGCVADHPLCQPPAIALRRYMHMHSSCRPHQPSPLVCIMSVKRQRDNSLRNNPYYTPTADPTLLRLAG
jgi:hypothetical protein